MNTKRIIFWVVFFVILALIVWGLSVSMNKTITVNGTPVGTLAPVSEADHVKGPVDAPVTLIEYSDFQCPACENYYWVVSKLVQEASTTMRLVYRHYPLPQHANAIPASMASEAAGLQGKFWDMYELLFKNHANWTDLVDPTSAFVGYAKEIGLNTARFTTDLKSAELRKHIDADLESGRVAGINATPTFFINGKAINNPQGYAEFKKLIDQAASGSTR